MNISLQKQIFIFLLTVAELLILYFCKDLNNSYFVLSGQSINEYLRQNGNYKFLLASYFQIATLFFIFPYILFSLVIITREIIDENFFIPINQSKNSKFLFIFNISSVFALSVLLIYIKTPEEVILDPYSWKAYLYSLSPVLWMVFLYSICGLQFSIKNLISLVLKNKLLIFTLIVLELVIFNPVIINSLVDFWSSLLLIPTIQLASAISRIFGLEYKMMPDFVDGMPAFGTNEFKVGIAPSCSGYEGMSLIIILLGAYLFMDRTSLRLFRSLCIIPIAGMIMFLLNGFRIFILVAIGHYWSPQVALDGFHKIGGWLNLLIVFIVSLLLLNNISFFQKEIKYKSSFEWGKSFLLAPLMLLIVTALLIKSIDVNFPWLYPIPVIVAFLFLFYFKELFLSFMVRPSVISIAIGALVFPIWIFFIPNDESKSIIFFQELNSAPIWFAILWLLFRVIGASIIIPIVEEFAFRGYIQPSLQSMFKRYGFQSISPILSLIVTSLLFGYVHSNILAGSVAGIFYGFAYLQRKQLIDAVFAHATTNSLLAIYVINFGYWSYW